MFGWRSLRQSDRPKGQPEVLAQSAFGELMHIKQGQDWGAKRNAERLEIVEKMMGMWGLAPQTSTMSTTEWKDNNLDRGGLDGPWRDECFDAKIANVKHRKFEVPDDYSQQITRRLERGKHVRQAPRGRLTDLLIHETRPTTRHPLSGTAVDVKPHQ